MADCSKTVDYIREENRMCKAYECCNYGSGCPMGEYTDYIPSNCISFVLSNTETAIKIVQKWSDEHPEPKPKTYADDFFEKFPHARGYSFDYDGTKVPSELMRCMLYNIGYACEFEGSKFCDADHRADCWREPYPEQGEANGA